MLGVMAKLEWAVTRMIMKRCRINLALPLIAAAAALLTAALASAQVAPLQTGQALDANYQIGSGGYNSAGGNVGGVNSQLYVTGQVTGLAGFRGRVPYSPPGTLEVNVPSNTFSPFIGQSVSAASVLRETTYRPSPYFSTANIVTSTHTLGADQGMYIQRYVEPATAQNLYTQATTDYQSVLVLPPAVAIRAIPVVRPIEQQIVPVTSGTSGITNATEIIPTTPTFHPGASLFLSAPTLQTQEEITKELAEYDKRVNLRVENAVDTRVDASVTPTPTPGAQKPEVTPGGPIPTGAPQQPVPSPVPGTEKNKLPSLPTASTNQDAFLDLLVNLQQRKNATIPTAPEITPAPTAGATSQPAGTQEPYYGPKATRPRTGKNIIEIGKDRSIIVHALAGENPDLFNTHMTLGQKRLKAGKYYDAAGEFSVALTVNSTNPMAYMGLALATFAAGEPLSASLQLQHGLEVFPPMMETRLDIADMMDVKTFDAQLALLDKRIKDQPNSVSLTCLAMFLHYSARQDDKAKDYAASLRKIAKDDKLMTSYADFVLTGKRPAEMVPKATTGK